MSNKVSKLEIKSADTFEKEHPVLTSTPTPEVKSDASGMKGIRATVTKPVADRLETAEESTKVERGILVEMALESLFKASEEERQALYELVIAKRVKATVSMKF